MARRRYLIAYDISDPQRLRRVCKVMESYGQRLQYSVFLCDLSGQEYLDWRSDIVRVMLLTDDSVVHIDLGPTRAAPAVGMLGRRRTLPEQGPRIV